MKPTRVIGLINLLLSGLGIARELPARQTERVPSPLPHGARGTR